MRLSKHFATFFGILSLLVIWNCQLIVAQGNAKIYYSDGKTTTNWWRGAGGTACCGCGIKHYGELPANFQPGYVKAVTFLLTGSRKNSYYETISVGPTKLKFKLSNRDVEAESRKAYPGETQPLNLPWVVRFEFDDPVYAKPGTPWALLDGDDEIYSAAILHLSNVKSRANQAYALAGTSDQNGCQYTYKETVWYSVKFDFTGGEPRPRPRPRPRPEPVPAMKLEIESLGGMPHTTEFVAKLGGREILRTMGADLSIQEEFGRIGDYNVALLSDHTGGNACVAQTYRIVRWKDDGSHRVTDRFGFCGGPEITRQGDTITFYFKSYPIPQTDKHQPAQTWVYSDAQLRRVE
jgi:hypothetical protein